MLLQALLILIGCISTHVYSITIVYNLRVAETVKTQLNTLKIKPSIAAGTAFAQWRHLLHTVHQSAYGGLFSYIFMKDSFYARVNTAVGHVRTKEDNNPLVFSRTQMDDIVFTAGFAKAIDESLSLAGSLHFGIPTHEDTSLQFLQFGTGHFALGAQIDAMYALNEKQAFIAATRFLHFFSREVKIDFGPIQNRFDFTVGNVADLFFAYQHQWNRRNQIEIGYNPTFIFDAHIKPFLPNVLPQINTTAHNFFGSYRYGFLIDKKYLSAIILGISAGIIPQCEKFGNTTIATVWFSWGINF